MSKYYKILIFILFIFHTSINADDKFDAEVEKAYQEFSENLQNEMGKIKNFPKADTKESQIIDKAVIELSKAIESIDEILISKDYENTEYALDFVSRSISDIQKLIPQEISSDMSKINIESLKADDLNQIKSVSSAIKNSKNEKLLEFSKTLDSLSDKGLDVYSITYNLNNMGVSTTSLKEIVNSANSDKKFQNKIISAIEQDLKKAGVSSKDIEKVKDNINIEIASIQKNGANLNNDSRNKELNDLISKAKDERQNAEKAREERNAALKAAEEARAVAEKAQQVADSISDKTSRAAKEASQKAQEAAKEAQEAIQKASQASMQYESLKGWLQSTENSIKELQKIQSVNENYNSLDNIYNNSIAAKNIQNISQKDFEKLEGLAARLVITQNPLNPGFTSAVETPEIQLAQNVYNSAIEAGLSETEAGVLADNAVIRYLDMQFVQKNAIAKFKSQGLSDVEASKKSLEIIQDKYSNWVNNIGFGKESTGKISSVDAWITSVAMAKKAATNFGTLDPNDEQELKASAQATADKVLNEAISQGFSKSEAEQIAKNTYETMFSGLKFAYQTGEALLQKGLSEEEMDQVLSKMIKDRFGTTEVDFFSPGNLSDVGDEKAIKFYVTGLGAMKYAMANREKSINPDDVDEVEKVISDTEKLVKERAAKLGITDQAKIDKFAMDAKKSVIDLYHFGYAIEDYLGGPENNGPCNQDCIDENIDFILDKFYSKIGARLFDVSGEELKLDVSKIDAYVTGLVVTESTEAAKLAKENAEKALKQAENTLIKARELEQKAKEAQAKADQIKDKTSKEYQDAVAEAEAARDAALAARDAAKAAASASEEAKNALKKAEQDLAELEKELQDLLKGIDKPKNSWNPDEKIAQNLSRSIKMSEIKSNQNLSDVMNSMDDKQVSALIASGALKSELVNEYIKNGENAPLDDLNYVFEEADRQMKISSVQSNELLSNVLNSLTDRQAYELIASGALPVDVVQEYIQNGANAPILPCGSADCSMIEYLNPGSTTGAVGQEIAKGPITSPGEIVGGPALEIPGLEITSPGEFMPAVDELREVTAQVSDELSGISKELSSEVQQMAQDLGIADITAAAAAAAGVDVSEVMPSEDAMSDPNFDAEAHNRAMQEKIDGGGGE
jgi:hypothetical protein